jgi:sorting and assembly machinery component 37
VAEESKNDDIDTEVTREPKTVSTSLGKSTHRNQFRLDVVTSEFFKPLHELLAEKEWLIAETLTSLDCLAIGYLALMQTPQLPHNWLRRHEGEISTIGRWTAAVARRTFGRPTDPGHALSPLL